MALGSSMVMSSVPTLKITPTVPWSWGRGGRGQQWGGGQYLFLYNSTEISQTPLSTALHEFSKAPPQVSTAQGSGQVFPLAYAGLRTSWRLIICGPLPRAANQLRIPFHSLGLQNPSWSPFHSLGLQNPSWSPFHSLGNPSWSPFHKSPVSCPQAHPEYLEMCPEHLCYARAPRVHMGTTRRWRPP